jgi:hypothetical protein
MSENCVSSNRSATHCVALIAPSFNPVPCCIGLNRGPWRGAWCRSTSTFSSSSLKAICASCAAARARSSCPSDRTNMPSSCGRTPAFARSRSQFATVLISSASSLSDAIVGGGPLNTETVSLRSRSPMALSECTSIRFARRGSLPNSRFSLLRSALDVNIWAYCFQSSPGMILRMNSSNKGTVKAVSPWLGLQIMPFAIN